MKLIYKKYKKCKKGSGSIIIGVSILLTIFIATAVVMDSFNMFNSANKLQMVCDLAADGSAVDGNSVIGFKSEQEVKKTAVSLVKANGYSESDIDVSVDNLDNSNTGKKVTVTAKTKNNYIFQNLYKTSNNQYNTSFIINKKAVTKAIFPFVYNSNVEGFSGDAYTRLTTQKLSDYGIVPTNEGNRNPQYNNYIVNDFLNPAHNSKYLPNNNETYCNFFMYDYLVAMGINSVPCDRASNMYTYLHNNSGSNGEWIEYTKQQVSSNPSKYATKIQSIANKGIPVIIVMRNNAPSNTSQVTGHCAVVVPSQNGNLSSRQISTAQSGSTTWNYRVFDITIWCQMDEKVSFFIHKESGV